MSNKKKVLILTDSVANPRAFPVSDKTELEETYPYLIREKFSDFVFWQLSLGDALSNKLYAQAVSYLHHWSPDIIIVHSGINDCRPEMASISLKMLKKISKLLDSIFKSNFSEKLDKKNFSINKKTSKTDILSFKRTLKKFKLSFPKAIIYWIEICSGDEYENDRPGFNIKADKFNQVIKEIYDNNMIAICDLLKDEECFNVDNLHWKKSAHNILASILIERISIDINNKNS